MVEASEMISIKVRTLDATQFEIQVHSSMTVADLKEIISVRTQVPADRQRLIYQGKLLKNPDTLDVYRIGHGHVLQLVANTQQVEELPREEENRQDPLNDLLRLALDSTPAALLTRRRRRFHRRREIDINERYETIRQNLQTLDSLLNILNNSPSEGEIPTGFDISRRQLHRGQWVDVKDTVDQWLEAQVLDLQHTPRGTLAFIHYNGWPNRWDEWIDVTSSRIQPLRTYTVQALASPMYSPFPVVPCDAESLPPNTNHDMNEYLLQSCSLLEQVKGMLERYYSLNTILRHERAGERVQPLRERLRMLNVTYNQVIHEVEEEKNWQHPLIPGSESSEATVGSDRSGVLSPISSFEESSQELTTEQEFNLLTVQLSPLLDRTGRMLTDMAALIAGGPTRAPDDTASVSSSLITNESGVSLNSRTVLQVPVMPSPADLANSSPRLYGSDIDIHIHAIFSSREPREEPRNEEDRNSNACWRQLS
jgi:hypothetical protein